MDTYEKFSKQTLFLHWIVAIGMIGMLASGVYMHENDAYSVYPWHKSFGVLIVVFVLWRIFWRIKNGWPKPVQKYSTAEVTLSKIVHWLLILATILMPVSGMMMSGLGGHGIPLFGIELLPRNPDVIDPSKVVPLNETLAGLGKALHGLGGNLLIAAILLHIAGALKHHLIDKDFTLKRMLGKRIEK